MSPCITPRLPSGESKKIQPHTNHAHLTVRSAGSGTWSFRPLAPAVLYVGKHKKSQRRLLRSLFLGSAVFSLVLHIPVRPLTVPATVAGRLALSALAEGRAMSALLRVAIGAGTSLREIRSSPLLLARRGHGGGLGCPLLRSAWGGS